MLYNYSEFIIIILLWHLTYEMWCQNLFLFSTAFVKLTKVNNQDYEVKLIDTAGQDEYSILPTQYSMDIHGYVLVYSITSPKSFEIVQIIYDKLLDMTGKVQ